MNRNTHMLARANESTSELRYAAALTLAMRELGADARTCFLGQSVAWPGTAMYGTLEGVPMAKRREMPVAEEMQMGITLGLALAGFVPVSLYPRLNFLLLAINQLVNHVDKIAAISRGGYRPHLIIRSSIGSVRPLDPQEQHRGDYSAALASMCTGVLVWVLKEPEEVLDAYRHALREPGAYLLIEHADYLNEK